jgi:hypothetical protein
MIRWNASLLICLSLCWISTPCQSTESSADNQPALPSLSPDTTKAAPLPAELRGTTRGYQVQQVAAPSHRTSARSITKRQSERKSTNPNHETYRGYFLDLTAIADRQDFLAIADALRHQIDVVESVGLSQRVLQFFHTVPIVTDEFACLSSGSAKSDTKSDTERPVLAVACYGPFAPERFQRTSHRIRTFWDHETLQWANPDPVDLAEDTHRGVVMVRPRVPDPQAPILLHEFLHAYHANILPQGVKNSAVLFYHNVATSKQLYPADAYLMTNEKEFFAVTASVFLYGRANQEPFTRSNLKQKQPEYYQYLVWLFGFDPDGAPSSSPVASVN